jgi:hypothetical protein
MDLSKPIVLDLETYPNYILFAFKSAENKRVKTFELIGENSALTEVERREIAGIMNRVTFGYNSNNFDLPIIAYALSGADAAHCCAMANHIIKEGSRSWQTYKHFNLKEPRYQHFDLFDPAPSPMTGLKIYGGRLHAPTLQDLPIAPNTMLTPDQMELIKTYCINDLDTTIQLFERIRPQMDLRVAMSKQYGLDLMSKSDAQIAEAVIVSELGRGKVKPPHYGRAERFRYAVPGFVHFESENLQAVLEFIRKHEFSLDGRGAMKLPAELAPTAKTKKSPVSRTAIKIGDGLYQIGIGGLHSTESAQTVEPGNGERLIDQDVTSYYPSIILNQGLYPVQLGPQFLDVYRSIVARRIAAKKAGDKTTAESLKIVINGSFGKFGNQFSALYSPQLLIQVTLTGQLALLMLIESLTIAGCRVVSANTDGITAIVPHACMDAYDDVLTNWQAVTGFNLEGTEYRAMLSRDVNNYIALKNNGQIKSIGVFAAESLKKNPDMAIIPNAVKRFIADGVPIAETIKGCTDIRQFVAVRKVTGGAVWDAGAIWQKVKTGEKVSKVGTVSDKTKEMIVEGGTYLGKVARWYWSTNASGIHYKTNSNKVPRADNSTPAMVLPDAIPADLDYGRYIQEAYELLENTGYFNI